MIEADNIQVYNVKVKCGVERYRETDFPQQIYNILPFGTGLDWYNGYIITDCHFEDKAEAQEVSDLIESVL